MINKLPIKLEKWTTSCYEDPKILAIKKVFLSYIACNERLVIFSYAYQQKYFFSLQWHEEKAFKHLFIISKLFLNNQNPCITLLIFK